MVTNPSILLSQMSETVTLSIVETTSTDNVTESETVASPIQETAPGNNRVFPILYLISLIRRIRGIQLESIRHD